MKKSSPSPRPSIIPKLDLKKLSNYEQDIVLPPIEQRINQHKKVVQDIKNDQLSSDTDIRECAIDAMVSANHAIGLMQGIVGNEADSHVERIRKERIPLSQRQYVQQETKIFGESYKVLVSSYKTQLDSLNPSPLNNHTNGKLEIDETDTVIDKETLAIHKEYLEKFIHFLDKCNNALDNMLKFLPPPDRTTPGESPSITGNNCLYL